MPNYAFIIYFSIISGMPQIDTISQNSTYVSKTPLIPIEKRLFAFNGKKLSMFNSVFCLLLLRLGALNLNEKATKLFLRNLMYFLYILCPPPKLRNYV